MAEASLIELARTSDDEQWVVALWIMQLKEIFPTNEGYVVVPNYRVSPGRQLRADVGLLTLEIQSGINQPLGRGKRIAFLLKTLM